MFCRTSSLRTKSNNIWHSRNLSFPEHWCTPYTNMDAMNGFFLRTSCCICFHDDLFLESDDKKSFSNSFANLGRYWLGSKNAFDGGVTFTPRFHIFLFQPGSLFLQQEKKSIFSNTHTILCSNRLFCLPCIKLDLPFPP